jgi:energy-coupling factor transporter ATP-binding protein EcfA2
MKKLILNLENCYGIKKLETEFNFSEKKNTFAIYAPNGVMKTSLAKTFKDLSKNKDSKDLVFTERETKREIQNEDGDNLSSEEVFVIEPYNEQFNSDKLSTLVVKKELREKYDKAHQSINEAKENFLEKIGVKSGLTSKKDNIQEEIEKSFNGEFFDIIEGLEKQIKEGESTNFSEIEYSQVFNDKSLAFLGTSDFKTRIKAYIEKYNEIIEESTYLKRDFNYYHATTVQKNLKDNGFFEARHSVNLFNGHSRQEITNSEDFKELVKQEKEKILDSEDLQKEFDTIDKKLSNAQLRDLRNYLLNHKEILPELENLEDFQKKLWIAYFIKQKELYENLVSNYREKKIEISWIIEEAKNEKTDWESAVRDFNDRFKGLPFKLKIENKDDVILKTKTPSIKFIFHDSGSGEEKEVERKNLLEILSQGERRALYILNIIFEVEARKKGDQKTLFIVDDIVDSFDYKNKYAIIEYLKDISKENNFYQIILTHNFDFFRTIEGRFVGRGNCKMVVKTESKISLESASYLKPFNYFKDNLDKKDEILIASIPFVRNLAEYCGHEEQYKKLTSLLHIKKEGGEEGLKIKDLETIFKTVLKDKKTLELKNHTKSVFDLIFELADKISQNTDETIELENKIVLSIAIRLKAEIFMIKKINNQGFIEKIKKNQTVELIKEYKNKFPTETKNVELLEQINLMPPENIHLNSFMYEPILDMSNESLRYLYIKTRNKEAE